MNFTRGILAAEAAPCSAIRDILFCCLRPAPFCFDPTRFKYFRTYNFVPKPFAFLDPSVHAVIQHDYVLRMLHQRAENIILKHIQGLRFPDRTS